jgi:hypothetical protein
LQDRHAVDRSKVPFDSRINKLIFTQEAKNVRVQYEYTLMGSICALKNYDHSSILVFYISYYNLISKLLLPKTNECDI